MIRKLASGGYRLYSRKKDRRPASAGTWVPSTRERRQKSTSGQFNISNAMVNQSCYREADSRFLQSTQADPLDATASVCLYLMAFHLVIAIAIPCPSNT